MHRNLNGSHQGKVRCIKQGAKAGRRRSTCEAGPQGKTAGSQHCEAWMAVAARGLSQGIGPGGLVSYNLFESVFLNWEMEWFK